MVEAYRSRLASFGAQSRHIRGGLCHNDPASEMPLWSIAGATLNRSQCLRRRPLLADKFFTGVSRRAGRERAVGGIRVPIPAKRHGWSFQEAVSARVISPLSQPVQC